MILVPHCQATLSDRLIEQLRLIGSSEVPPGNVGRLPFFAYLRSPYRNAARHASTTASGLQQSSRGQADPDGGLI